MLELNRNLEVALLSPEYPPSSIGGISTVCYDLSINLSKQGISTTVFCGKSNTIAVEKVSDCLRVVHMPLLSLPPRHLWFQVQNINPLLAMLKEFDIVHSVDPRSAFLAYFSKKLQKPFITHVHGCGHCETTAFVKSPISYWSVGDFVYTILEYPLNEYLTSTCLHHSDYLVVCSAARLDEMKRRNPDLDYTKVSVIYNGIDFNKINPENDAVEEDCSILFWGRLYYNKGIIQLIKAMALVKNDYPMVLLDVCGKGPLEAKIRSLIRKLGLEDNVRVHGYVTLKDLVSKIKAASLIALPSLYEGQPVAVLEAMAYKKPVVLYDFPFAREYVTDWHNGLIAKGGDVEDLAERLRAALSDKKLRLKLGQNAYDRVRKDHNWDTLVRKYIDLYSSLVQQNRRLSK